MSEKKRLFVDMDGTLAAFHHVETFEILLEEGYYRNLEPQQFVVDAVRDIIKKDKDIEVYVLSSYLKESAYALQEKNQWLDQYLPEIDSEHRIFPPVGEDKREFTEQLFYKRTGKYANLGKNDFLLDDYTINLNSWEPPARGIKLLNGINHTRGTWQNAKVEMDRGGILLAKDIRELMNGYPSVEIEDEDRVASWENLKKVVDLVCAKTEEDEIFEIHNVDDISVLPEFYVSFYGQSEYTGFDSWMEAVEYLNDKKQYLSDFSRDVLDLVSHTEKECWEAVRYEDFRHLFRMLNQRDRQRDSQEVKLSEAELSGLSVMLMDKYRQKKFPEHFNAAAAAKAVYEDYVCGDITQEDVMNQKLPDMNWVYLIEAVLPGAYQKAYTAYDLGLIKNTIDRYYSLMHEGPEPLNEEKRNEIAQKIRAKQGWETSMSAALFEVFNQYGIGVVDFKEELYRPGNFNSFIDNAMMLFEAARNTGIDTRDFYNRIQKAERFKDWDRAVFAESMEDFGDVFSDLKNASKMIENRLEEKTEKEPYVYNRVGKVLDSFHHSFHEVYDCASRQIWYEKSLEALIHQAEGNDIVRFVPSSDIARSCDNYRRNYGGFHSPDLFLQEYWYEQLNHRSCGTYEYLKDNNIVRKNDAVPEWFELYAKYAGANIDEIYENGRAEELLPMIEEAVKEKYKEDVHDLPEMVVRGLAGHVAQRELEYFSTWDSAENLYINYRDNYRHLENVLKDGFIEDPAKLFDMRTMFREQFLDKYPEITETQYGKTYFMFRMLMSKEGRDYMNTPISQDHSLSDLPKELQEILKICAAERLKEKGNLNEKIQQKSKQLREKNGSEDPQRAGSEKGERM